LNKAPDLTLLLADSEGYWDDQATGTGACFGEAVVE
jgi:hypothetical protein